VGARSLKLDVEPHAAQRPSKPGGDQGATKISPKWNEEVMAKVAAQQIAHQVKKGLKDKTKG